MVWVASHFLSQDGVFDDRSGGSLLLLGVMLERIVYSRTWAISMSPHGRRRRGRNQTVVAYQEIGQL